MALIETVPAEVLYENHISSGEQLAYQREKLIHHLAKNRLDDEEFTSIAADYLNKLQVHWFERDEEARYENYNKLSFIIKNELSTIFDSVEPIEDIEIRLKTYSNDETAIELLDQGISPYPRSATLIMLDLIDEYR